MKTSNWKVRFNAPKQEREPETSLETELDAVAGQDEDQIGNAVPDSDPNRPMK